MRQRRGPLCVQFENAVPLFFEGFIARVKIVKETGGNPFERPHGRCRIKKFDPDQVDFTRSERICAAENLSDIETRFQMVQDNDKRIWSRGGEFVQMALSMESFDGQIPFRTAAPAQVTRSHQMYPFQILL